MYSYLTLNSLIALSLISAMAGSPEGAVPVHPACDTQSVAVRSAPAPGQLALIPSLVEEQESRDEPSQAWLSRMVRPCSRSGNRVLC